MAAKNMTKAQRSARAKKAAAAGTKYQNLRSPSQLSER